MLWFSLALLTAFFSATEGAWIKRYLADFKPLEMAAYPFFYALPFFLVGLCFIKIPELGPGFWAWSALLLPVNITGFLLHMRSIQLAPLSLTLPFLAFTPGFVILTGWLALGETLNPAGISGIAAIIAGGYVMGLDKNDRSLLAPFKMLANQPGPRYMLAASFVYSICAVVGKKLLLLSSPLFFGFFFFATFGVILVGTLLLLRKVSLKTLTSRPLPGLAVGVLLAAHIGFHHLSIALTKAAYMMAIKRLNGIFAVFYGAFWLKEEHLRQRLLGTLLMTLGAVVIGLCG